MKSIRRHFIELACVTVVLCVSGTAKIALSQAVYDVIGIGTLGGLSSSANAINTLLQVTGSSDVPGGSDHAFMWENGLLMDLQTLGGTYSVGTDISDAGQVVGYSEIPGGATLGFIWESDSLSDLGTLGGSTSSAYGINNSGQVVGVSRTSEGAEHAFLWQNGEMTDLQTPGGEISRAFAVNNSGQVVGDASVSGPLEAGGSSHAYLWQVVGVDSVWTDLGTLGGDDSEAWAINDVGQVVGWSKTGQAGEEHAFLWQSGVMIDLQTLGGSASYAWGINNAGAVVGGSTLAVGDLHAFLWVSNELIDLNSLIDSSSGWTLSSANDINDNGEIVGFGFHDGDLHGFVLIPRSTGDVDERDYHSVASEYKLLQNYPNPFNPVTAISYQLPTVSYVTLRVYNLLGHEVATLVDEIQEAGYRRLEWRAEGVASGVFFYRVEARATNGSTRFYDVKKMMVIK